MAALPRLMLVTDRRRLGDPDFTGTLRAALAAGPAMIQIREKDLPPTAMAALVKQVLDWAGDMSPILVNGQPQVAADTGVGLHLPAEQAAAAGARPPCRFLGCSVHNRSEIRSALALEPDYLVAGTVYPTGSKPGLDGCGIDGLRQLAGAAEGVPVYAIGGMEPDKVAAVLDAGAYGVAVSGYVLGSGEPEQAARRFHDVLGGRSTLTG